MKCTCRHCGEEFTVSKETRELIEEGWEDRPDSCDDCQEMIDNSEVDYSMEPDNGL